MRTTYLTEGKQRAGQEGVSGPCVADQAPDFFARPHHRLLSFTTEPCTGDHLLYTGLRGALDPNYSTDLDIIVTVVPSKRLTISKHCKR